MIDDAVVVSARNEWAQVKVEPKVACCTCSARAFCQGEKGADGILSVLNPMHARPGDFVQIDVPDVKYEKETIRLFGFLLLSSLAGLAMGSLAAPLFGLGTSEAGFLGVLFGLGLGGLTLYRYFRRPGKRKLYPVITAIIGKGEFHG